MSLSLTFKDSRVDGWPPHKSKISYYVLDDNPYLHQELHPQYAEITYGWYSECHEVFEHYDPIKESGYKLGDSRPSTYFSDDENESHRTVYLSIQMEEYSFDENQAHIAWMHTHDMQREISKHQSRNYFPCFDINNLLREGVVTPVSFEKVVVGEESNQYYHVYGVFKYMGENYLLKMSQDSQWSEDSWVKDGEYGDVSIYQWTKL
ncbi:TPA: hypothetical protein I6W52_003573 [Vibrio cholerae]|nr:hypothetical protein [Vibrio cholerae]